MQADSHAIVLTGGIATGKSSAGEILQQHGLALIDADRIAHRVLDAQAAEIAVLFGEQFLSEGMVDRKALGALVFADSDKRKVLESLLHPLIREEILQRSSALDREGVLHLVDLPLFFESGQYPFEKVIVVYAPRRIQKQRLMARNGYTSAEAEARLDAQMDIEEKRARADYIIDNSGDLAQLERECLRVKDMIFAKNTL